MSNPIHSPGWSFKPGSPQVRGFDTPELYIEDALARVKRFARRIAEHRQNMEKTRRELSARKKRIQELKRGLGGKILIPTPDEVATAGPKRPLGIMDTVKFKLSWEAFSEIYHRYRFRVLSDMGADRVLFTDGSVIFHIPVVTLGDLADRVLDQF